MSAAAIISHGANSGTDFLVASHDGIHLLFHEHEVKSVEMIGDLAWPVAETAGAFLYRRDDEEYPVFALDRNLGILPALPAQRQHFVLLANGSGGFGIACDQTTLLRGAKTLLMPLPECMQGPLSPVQGMTLIADGIGFYCPSSRLAAYLTRQLE